jgi:tetratricopeptide (TPR) repeat protein
MRNHPRAILGLVLLSLAGAATAFAADPPVSAPAGPSPGSAAGAPSEPGAGAPSETGAVAPSETGAADPSLPVPPVPPRIATGADYEHCLGMLSDDPPGAATFADAWIATGGGDGALHCQALAQIALGNPQAGAAMLAKLAAASTAPALARAMIFGQSEQAWMMASQPDRAYDAATQALALKPDDADLLIDRANAAVAMGRFMDAIDDLNRALELDPRRADALVLRGAAWRNEGKIDTAEADIDHAIDIDPDDPEALLQRGILRQRKGDQAGARADWERAITLDPDSTAADLAQQDLALLEAGPDRR